MEFPGASFAVVVTIVDHGKGRQLTDSLAAGGLAFNTIIEGRGTAAKSLLARLGLRETHKDILISGMPEWQARHAVDTVCQTLRLDLPGRGISFAVPVDYKTSGMALRMPLGRVPGKGALDMEASTHCLIFNIMNRGYSDTVMETARGAGAPGGTVIPAQSAGFGQVEKILGVSLQPEREVLLILGDTNTCGSIVDAIAEHHGIGSAAGTITFSIPIGYIAGLAKKE